MNEESVSIPIKNWKEPHILLMCIFIPWGSNRPKLEDKDIELQEKWRKEFLRLREDDSVTEFVIPRDELTCLIPMIEKGLNEYINAEEFGTIIGVGNDPQIAFDLIKKLKTFIS